MMHNKYTRSAGFIPYDWAEYTPYSTNIFHYGGGLNLRGYSGYYMPESTDEWETSQNYVYRGIAGAAFNTEIDFTNTLPYLKHFGITSYLFMDAGFMDNNHNDAQFLSSNLYMDSGFGFTLEISKLWSRTINAKPLVLRMDFWDG